MSETTQDDSTPQDSTDRGVLIEVKIHSAPRKVWVEFRVSREMLTAVDNPCGVCGLAPIAHCIGSLILDQYRRLVKGDASMNYAQEGRPVTLWAPRARDVPAAETLSNAPITPATAAPAPVRPRRVPAKIEALVSDAVVDHLILYGDPEAPPSPLQFPARSPKGAEGWPPPETTPFCSWGAECPIHPDGKGGPWVD